MNEDHIYLGGKCCLNCGEAKDAIAARGPDTALASGHTWPCPDPRRAVLSPRVTLAIELLNRVGPQIPYDVSAPKCECGAASVGIVASSVGHSSWCPVRA